MKKLFLLLSLAVASSTGYSLIFTPNSDSAKYTTATWQIAKGSGGLKEKIFPRAADSLEFHSSFEIDVDNQSFAGLAMLNGADVLIRNKRALTFRGGFTMVCAGSNNATNAIRIENSAVTLGGSIRISNYDHVRSLGRSVVELIDSKLISGGNLIYTMPSAYMNARANHSGAEIIVTGNSSAIFDAKISPDSILSKNKDIMFRMVFNEKDGKVPFIQADSIILTGTNIDINVKSKLKKGVYPILVSSSGDKFIGSCRKITFNGSEIKVGASKTVNGSKITLKDQAFLGTGSNLNDYVLVVE